MSVLKKGLGVFATGLILAGSLSACSSGTAEQEIVIWNAGIQTTDDSGNIAKEDLPFNKAIAQFEADNPGYKIVVSDYSMDDLQKAFTAANLSKKGPDMVALWAGSSTQAYADYLIDFNSYLSADEKGTYDVSALLHANNSTEASLIGLNYGMPSTFVMYYNKQIFADNGVTVPTTFEELAAVSKQLKAKGVTPMVVGDKDGYNSTWAVSSLLANEYGADGIAALAPGGADKISGEKFAGALSVWKDYVNDGNTNPDYLTLSDGDAIQKFVQGNAAMIIHGNWAAREFVSMEDNVEVAKIPAMSANAQYKDYIVSQPNINLVVTNYSTVQDKAAEFAKYLSSPEFTKESNEAFYSDPTASRLSTTIDEYAAVGNNVTGFDSIISGEAAAEFYKLVPTYLSGSITLDDFTSRLDKLNIASGE